MVVKIMDYQTIIDQRFKEYRAENQMTVDRLSKIRNDFGDAVLKFTVDKFKIKVPVSKDVDSSYNTTIKLCEIIDKLRHYKYDTKDITGVRLPYPSKSELFVRFDSVLVHLQALLLLRMRVIFSISIFKQRVLMCIIKPQNFTSIRISYPYYIKMLKLRNFLI